MVHDQSRNLLTVITMQIRLRLKIQRNWAVGRKICSTGIRENQLQGKKKEERIS